MTRQEYIDAVKVKIEEISPFDEPESFIADDDSSANTVKPIISYIDKSLDEAAKNCLMTLPLSLLHADVERSNPTMVINNRGVGEFAISPNRRFIRFRHSSALERDITAFITSEDPQYLVMQNPHCRPKQCKTMAVVSSDADNGAGQMEIYSYPESLCGTTQTDAYLLSIDLTKKPNSDATGAKVLSPIEDLIVLECARMVLNILKDYDGAKVCENEQAEKIQAILK
jgi:hypothetical protein